MNLVSPMDGPVYGGFAVVIEGRGFIDTGKIIVRFQLYTEPQQQEATPRIEEENASQKAPQTQGLSPVKSASFLDKRPVANSETSSPAVPEQAASYVDVVAKFVSSERILCQAPAFPRKGCTLYWWR